MSAANSSSPSLPSPVISSVASASDIQQPSSFERASEGDLVGVLQVAAHRQTARKSGDLQPHRLDEAREVGRGRLALEVGVGREDELGDLAVGEADHQLAHTQVVGADALDRADRAAEHVVATTELARLL